MWTKEEEYALRLYSGQAYHSINDYLRGTEEADPETLATISTIDRAFSDAHISDSIVTYRGVNGDAAAYIRHMMLQVGDAFTDPGYASTSISPERARLFAAWPADGMILRIHVGENMRGIDMSPFSDFPEEGEFLLPRGTRFRVLALEDENGFLEVEALHGE